MSAKPRFKSRVGWAVNKSLIGKGWVASKMHLSTATHRVRVVDARDLTPEKAVEKVLQELMECHRASYEGLAKAAGMSARVVNGMVRVRREKQ